MKIREATAADLDIIIHQRLAMFRDMGYDERQLAPVAEAARQYYAAALPRGGYHGWLAEEDGKVVAGAGVVISDWPGHPRAPQPRRAMILNVYTEPEHRHRGYARHLMTTILDWCRGQGFGAVALHGSKDGRPLYEQMGFTPTNELRLELRH